MRHQKHPRYSSEKGFRDLQKHAPKDIRGLLNIQGPRNSPSLAIIQRLERSKLVSMFLD
jgi:hypothetical protein